MYESIHQLVGNTFEEYIDHVTNDYLLNIASSSCVELVATNLFTLEESTRTKLPHNLYRKTVWFFIKDNDFVFNKLFF